MITSLTNDRIKHVVRLSQRARLRKDEGLFVCEGKRLVAEIPPGRLREIYYTASVMKDSRLFEWITARSGEGIFAEEVSESVMEKMSQTVHSQGIVALASIQGYTKEDIMASHDPMLLILDRLSDPGNLGTILRTAEAAGVSGVVASCDTVDWYSPKVIRSTMGSIFRLPHLAVDDLCGFIISLKNQAFEINCALLSRDSVAYDSINYCRKNAIIIGNESNGVRPEISSLCSNEIFIPMHGKTESLNASIAGAVILFEAARQRREHDRQQ